MAIDKNSTIFEVCKAAVDSSNSFEELGRTKIGAEAKKKYIQSNYDKYREIAGDSKHAVLMFTTGYPGYDLSLKEIDEQYRYNNELMQQVAKRGMENMTWKCGGCLVENYHRMPDLKMVCYPCAKIPNEIKPRKILNRLPDLDVWYVYDDTKAIESDSIFDSNRAALMREIESGLKKQGLETSDTNPIKAINDMAEIADTLKRGKIPAKGLPVDVHVVGLNYLKNLIASVPNYMHRSMGTDVEELKINPFSLRKKWDFDSQGYNYVFDFLMAFTILPYNANSKIMGQQKDVIDLVNQVRSEIFSMFTEEEVFDILCNVAGPSSKRRIGSPFVMNQIKQKFTDWRNGDFEKGNWLLESLDSDEMQRNQE